MSRAVAELEAEIRSIESTPQTRMTVRRDRPVRNIEIAKLPGLLKPIDGMLKYGRLVNLLPLSEQSLI